MANKPKNNPNDDLVDALESIRGLLEKSETKLSAARDSLEKAKSTPIEKRTKPTQTHKKPPISNEPVVPVLDDIVFTDDVTEDSTTHNDDTMTDIPSLDFGAIISKPEASPPTPQEKTPSAPSRKAILSYIDKIESSLEQRIHDAMLDTMVKVEMEIKNTVAEELKALRKMITDKK